MLYFEGTFSKDDLDAVFRGLGKDTFFLQVGANDGRIDDPIHAYVKELGWSGMLIEPMPDIFAQLKTNYDDCEGLIFENLAVTDYDGTIEMFTVVDPVLPTYPKNQVASVTPEQSFFGINDPTLAKKIDVSCNRLTPILDRHAIKKIDLLVVDVEGADWLVTRQLSMERYQPLVVLVEYHQMSSYEKLAFGEHFRNYGYRVYLGEPGLNDFLAVKWQAVRGTALMHKIPVVATDSISRKTNM